MLALPGILVAATLVACKSHRAPDAGGGGGGGGGRGSGPAIDQSEPGQARAIPSVAGTVRNDRTPVSGVTVTAVDRAGVSVTTGADGKFLLRLPVGSTQTLRMSHGADRPIQSTLVVGATDFDFETLDSAEITRIYSSLSLTEDPAQGTVLLRFDSPGMPHRAGFGVTLSVPGGTRFVTTESGAVRRETTTADDHILGIANVPAGTVTITPVPPSGTCAPTFGTMTVRVDPRTITWLSFTCH